MKTETIEQLPFFVYGTLRAGHGNYQRLLAGRHMEIETGIFENGKIYGVNPSHSFPCLVESQEGEVVGELIYAIPDLYEHVVRDCDMLEGYRWDDEKNSMYVRRIYAIRTQSGEYVNAWVYVWNGHINESNLIATGDFNDVRRVNR